MTRIVTKTCSGEKRAANVSGKVIAGSAEDRKQNSVTDA